MNNSQHKKKPRKAKNRKRQGYELTRQRDMMPILLGAATATLTVLLFFYIVAPHVFEGSDSVANQPPESIKEDTKRVYFKTAIERTPPPPPEPEKELPPEVEPQPEEKRDIDIFEEQIKPLEMSPGDTNIIVKAEISGNVIFNKPIEKEASTELNIEKLHVEEAILSNDVVPLNANDTVINLAPENSTEEMAGTTMDADATKDNKFDGWDDLTADTKSLDDLLSQGHLSSQSGVARLGTDVLFAFNSVTLQQSALVDMQRLAVLIQVNPDTYFIIEGHSDSIGGKSKNAIISAQRAVAVRAWLEEMGVPIDNVYIRVCAFNSPLVSTKGTEAEQKMNRRVEIHMRSQEEGVPDGCENSSYTIPLDKNITRLLESGFPIPKTYDTLSKRSKKGEDGENQAETQAETQTEAQADGQAAEPADNGTPKNEPTE